MVLARRSRIDCGYLDSGDGPLGREASHRANHLAHPFGVEAYLNLWLNRWLLGYTQSWILSRQQADPPPLSSDPDFRDFVVPHSFTQVLRFYAASLAGHLACGALLQPLGVLMTIQAGQMNHRISPRQALALVRSVPDKSLWDGCLARCLHGFAFQTVDDLSYHLLLNACRLHHAAPHYDDCLWNPRTGPAALRASAWRCYVRWALRMAVSRTASLLASLATAPLAMLRTRLEGQGCSARIPVRWTGATSLIDCFARIWRSEGGAAAFYRGVEHECLAYLQDIAVVGAISVGVIGILSFSLTEQYFEHNRHSIISRFLRFVLTKPPVGGYELAL